MSPGTQTDSFIEQIQASKKSKGKDKLSSYETPLVTVDIVVLTIDQGKLKLLLIQRKSPPYQDKWALPGGFIQVNETLEEAAQRRLREETSVDDIYLEQLYSFGAPNRDPRARVITVAYYALISADKLKLQANANAQNVGWFDVANMPDLAFDHFDIYTRSLLRLRSQLKDSNVASSSCR